jgi:hypothetical protein
MGMLQLIGTDVLRPGLPWLLATGCPVRVADEMARVRDPGGVATLKAAGKTSVTGNATVLSAIERIALIMAAKGGTVGDITPGDCLELLQTCHRMFTSPRQHSPFFYQRLHAAGFFPAGARPPSGCSTRSSPASSASTRWWTVTNWPAVPSATCWRTTCASASPLSTTTP